MSFLEKLGNSLIPLVGLNFIPYQTQSINDSYFPYGSVRKTRELVVGDAKPAARKAKKSGVMKCILDLASSGKQFLTLE